MFLWNVMCSVIGQSIHKVFIKPSTYFWNIFKDRLKIFGAKLLNEWMIMATFRCMAEGIRRKNWVGCVLLNKPLSAISRTRQNINANLKIETDLREKSCCFSVHYPATQRQSHPDYCWQDLVFSPHMPWPKETGITSDSLGWILLH